MVGSTSSPPESEGAPAATPSPPPARTIGERLLAGRERAGLSIPAAAEKLHLDPKVIEALESDRFAELGAPVYVRGHLRRYAEFVGEHALELINAYNARESHAPPPDLTQVPHAERRADPRRLAKPALVAGVAGVLAVAVWWVLSGSRPSGDTAATADTATTAPSAKQLVPADPRPVASSAAPAATPAALSSSAVSSSAELVPAVAQVPVSIPAASAGASAPEPAARPAAAEPAPARSTQLRLELTHDSWVEVYDSRGERLFFDVASAGSVQNVEGRPPLRVVLGNAAGVNVEVDGQPREIPQGALDGEGARFVVNRSGSLRAR